MTEITSREELEEWLKDKPADWAQVIAVRAALRALPYAFAQRVKSGWLQDFAVAVFRSLALAWAAHSFTGSKLSIYAATAEAEDAAAYAAAAPDVGDPAATTCADAAAHAAAAVAAAVSDVPVVNDCRRYALDCVNLSALTFSFAAVGGMWENTSQDCVWIEEYPLEAYSALYYAGQHLWPREKPVNWQTDWHSATTRLLTLDPTYQVWIDWYNRRIEGHDASFDIPGDSDRVHDKAILARLADATDEDFWGKGATYVNTTLQRWIDDARLIAELESIVRKLEAGAATRFESPEARETLAAFRAKLVAALGNQPPAHAPIGHNHPPEGIDPAEVPILPPALREEARAMLVTLDQSTPNTLAVAKTLTGWSRLKSTFQHDEFSKNFSGELGTSAARGIVFILTTLCLLGLAWLKAILGI
jgi:hypothetical protein